MAFLNFWQGFRGITKPNSRLRLIKDHPMAQGLIFSLPMDLLGYRGHLEDKATGIFSDYNPIHGGAVRWQTTPYGPAMTVILPGQFDDNYFQWPAWHPMGSRLTGQYQFTVHHAKSRNPAIDDTTTFGNTYAGLTTFATNATSERINFGSTSSVRHSVGARNLALTGSLENRLSNIEIDSNYLATGINPQNILQQITHTSWATNGTDWSDGVNFWRRLAILRYTEPGSAGNIQEQTNAHQTSTNTEGFQPGIGEGVSPLQGWRYSWGGIQSGWAFSHYFHLWDRPQSRAEQIEFIQNPFNMFEPALAQPTYYLPTTTGGGFYLRPDADAAAGGWSNEVGATTNLYQSIDEATASDADYIQSSENPAADTVKIRLSDPSGSVDTASPVTIRYRYRKSGNGTMNLTVRLVEGVTTRATWAHTNISTTYTDATQTLSAGEKAAITDWTNLFLEFEANPA